MSKSGRETIYCSSCSGPGSWRVFQSQGRGSLGNGTPVGVSCQSHIKQNETNCLRFLVYYSSFHKVGQTLSITCTKDAQISIPFPKMKKDSIMVNSELQPSMQVIFFNRFHKPCEQQTSSSHQSKKIQKRIPKYLGVSDQNHRSLRVNLNLDISFQGFC